MSIPVPVTKAFLQEIEWDKHGNVKKEHARVPVQFNPESLKVAFSNQIAGDNNKGGSALQFASKGTTKLSFEMWFDVSVYSGTDAEGDVRKLTEKVVKFMRTKGTTGKGDKTKYIPPGCRFQWGSFLFEGVVESINENLEFFSDKGVPLRASVSVSMTKQDVDIKFASLENAKAATNKSAVGTQPQQQAR
ncbi:MAG: hypothetical protein OEY07_17280, partial [Gammaproteobacteria bacterium]|nr:hypothetical protein [Gammaproteobacteria bacterium]